MARTDPVFNLRMPSEMKDELAERAKRNGRSLNAEILRILEDSITAEKTGLSAGDARELRRVIQIQNDLIEGQKDMFIKLNETFSLIVGKLSKLSDQEKEIEKSTENKKPT